MSENIPTHLIVRYLSNEATDLEQEQLLEWVSRDVKNQKIFHEYSALWEKKNMGRSSFNLAKGLQRLNAQIDTAELKTVFMFPWRRLAAAVLLLITVSAVISLWIFVWSPQKAAVQYAEQKTGADQMLTVTLTDGSVVKLNENTSLRHPQHFDGSEREVYLEGEAFFTVTKNPGKPFIIHTQKLKTEVLGTSFNINARHDKISVTVMTGKVKVWNDNQQEVLLPEDKVIFEPQSEKMERLTADLDKELAWATNTIVFDDISLLAASALLEKQFKVSISFDNEALKNCRLTGKFRNEPLNYILEAISFSTGIKYELQDTKIKFSGKGCS